MTDASRRRERFGFSFAVGLCALGCATEPSRDAPAHPRSEAEPRGSPASASAADASQGASDAGQGIASGQKIAAGQGASDAGQGSFDVRAPEPAASDPETSDAAAPSRDAASEPKRGPLRHATFHCFGWVHGPEFSMDCFRTHATCEKARRDMKAGARDVLPECSTNEGAWCTKVGRGSAKGGTERCFGSLGNCRRYESYVQGNGLVTSGCEEK
ncbi:MAG: hypothetical protein U0263_32120 [Polyangiaceae bacterium]